MDSTPAAPQKSNALMQHRRFMRAHRLDRAMLAHAAAVIPGPVAAISG
jgi:hypothetical protein